MTDKEIERYLLSQRTNAFAHATMLEEQAERVERLYGQPSVRSKDLRRQASERYKESAPEVERFDRAFAALKGGNREEALKLTGLRIKVEVSETLEPEKEERGG